MDGARKGARKVTDMGSGTVNETKTQTAAESSTQVQRMQAAVDSAVALGPGFLRGEVDADSMANAMVAAVRGYVEQEKAAGSDGRPADAASRELFPALQELITCGSGYLAGRCDADCVARTMTEMVNEFAAS